MQNQDVIPLGFTFNVLDKTVCVDDYYSLVNVSEILGISVVHLKKIIVSEGIKTIGVSGKRTMIKGLSIYNYLETLGEKQNSRKDSE